MDYIYFGVTILKRVWEDQENIALPFEYVRHRNDETNNQVDQIRRKTSIRMLWLLNFR